MKTGEIVNWTEYGYDPQGEITEVRRADGYHVSLAYDIPKHIVHLTENGAETTYQYNGQGNFVDHMSRGVESVLSYDGDGRLKEAKGPLGAVVYTYGVTNKPTAITRPNLY